MGREASEWGGFYPNKLLWPTIPEAPSDQLLTPGNQEY